MLRARLRMRAGSPEGPLIEKDRLCRMLRLALLEMAGCVFAGVHRKLVRALPEALRHREIDASFYSWPTVPTSTLTAQPGKKQFVYTVKVCELITHVRRFKSTKTLIRDFGIIADILGKR